MRLPRSRRLPRALGVFAGVSALLLAGLATATPAQAGDVPPAPVTEFRAPVCAGTTSQDPKQVNPGDHHGETDLTRVFGARLVSYNKGNVVPLYDTFGGADGAAAEALGVSGVALRVARHRGLRRLARSQQPQVLEFLGEAPTT